MGPGKLTTLNLQLTTYNLQLTTYKYEGQSRWLEEGPWKGPVVQAKSLVRARVGSVCDLNFKLKHLVVSTVAVRATDRARRHHDGTAEPIEFSPPEAVA